MVDVIRESTLGYQQRCAQDILKELGVKVAALGVGAVVGHLHEWEEADALMGTNTFYEFRVCRVTKVPRQRRTLIRRRLETWVQEIHEKLIWVNLDRYPIVKCHVVIRNPQIFGIAEEKMRELASLIHATHVVMTQD